MKVQSSTWCTPAPADEVEVALLELCARGEIAVVGMDEADGLVFAHV